MGWRLPEIWRRLRDVGEIGTPFGRSLIAERYKTLQSQVPLIYLIILTNFIGVHLSTGTPLTPGLNAASLLFAVIVARLTHWLRNRGATPSPGGMVKEMRKVLLVAVLLSTGTGAWCLDAFNHSNPDQANYVVLFASLTALGCAYGLGVFPIAARLPLLLIALPLAFRLIWAGGASHVVAGISLTLVTLLMLRLLGIQNRGFARIVHSRTEIAAERERARRAEREALDEKSKAKAIAETDFLTGLANRRAFIDSLEAAIDAASAGGEGYALAMVDLDGFKPINDIFGHAAGDAILREVGRRLARAAGEGATVARMGGDEFALLLPGRDGEAAEAFGTEICAELRRPIPIEDRELRVSACCGFTLHPSGERRCPSRLLIQGDTALYHAKSLGGGRAARFVPGMEDGHRRRSMIEKALQLPENRERIELVYQPIFDLRTGRVRAHEALARWTEDSLGEISPAEFMPIAEQLNIVDEIGLDLLHKAVREAVCWPQDVRLSFNLSAVQLCSSGLAEGMLAILDGVGINPSRLQLEITETALLMDFEAARTNLALLRTAGARIILDDFGAGFASISYLREIQFDEIKLDGSLIASRDDPPTRQRLLKGVIDLCASLGVPCIAEHIETEAQLDLLIEYGCASGQGYFLQRPVPAESVNAAGDAILREKPAKAA